MWPRINTLFIVPSFPYHFFLFISWSNFMHSGASVSVRRVTLAGIFLRIHADLNHSKVMSCEVIKVTQLLYRREQLVCETPWETNQSAKAVWLSGSCGWGSGHRDQSVPFQPLTSLLEQLLVPVCLMCGTITHRRFKQQQQRVSG